MADTIRVAGVQMDIRLGATEQNLLAIQSHARQARAGGAGLIVFPECALTGYCCDSLDEGMDLAETLPGPSTQRMAGLCRELGVHVIYGLLEQAAGQLFNACVWVGPAGMVAKYRKVHLPGLGVDRFATPGNEPFAVHQADDMRIGMNICYDASFPEAARVLALQRADLIVLPTNWPPGAEATARHIPNARALENHIYFMAVNRVGTERGFRFIGQSKVCDVHGDTLAEADDQDECVIYADLDLRLPRDKHIVRVPEKHEIDRFADRRPEMYGQVVHDAERHSPAGDPIR